MTTFPGTSGRAGRPARFLLTWALVLFLGMVLFQFLHECGHGFGSQLDGLHVSTGFNRVGDAGKFPKDADFRSEQIETGFLGSGGLLGPFVNWMLAIFFTAWLLQRTRPGRATLFFGVGAVANALMRLPAMSLFFLGALLGRVHFEDEVDWGLGAVRGLHLPMPFADVRALAKARPGLFLAEPRLYFWPLLSFGISVLCFVLAQRRLRRIFAAECPSKLSRWAFWLMPVAVIPPMFLLCSWLDNVIRINW